LQPHPAARGSISDPLKDRRIYAKLRKTHRLGERLVGVPEVPAGRGHALEVARGEHLRHQLASVGESGPGAPFELVDDRREVLADLGD